MKRVEGVWAALSQPIKVDLSNASEIEALAKKVDQYITDAVVIYEGYQDMLNDYNAIRDSIQDLSKQAEKTSGDINSASNLLLGAKKEFIKQAGELGVSESMVMEILSDLNIDVDYILDDAQDISKAISNVAGRAGSLPELK